MNPTQLALFQSDLAALVAAVQADTNAQAAIATAQANVTSAQQALATAQGVLTNVTAAQVQTSAAVTAAGDQLESDVQAVFPNVDATAATAATSTAIVPASIATAA